MVSPISRSTSPDPFATEVAAPAARASSPLPSPALPASQPAPRVPDNATALWQQRMAADVQAMQLNPRRSGPAGGRPAGHDRRRNHAVLSAPSARPLHEVTDADLHIDARTPITEAASRWGTQLPAEQAQALAQAFCAMVLPLPLKERLESHPEGRALLTLCAGLAFTHDYSNPGSQAAQALIASTRADLHYLARHDDAQLLNDCLQAADDSVGQCGDRVSYGRTQMHMQIEKHQMIAENWPISRVFAAFDSHYNQRLVELEAAKFGDWRPEESVETYQYLATRASAAHTAPSDAVAGAARGSLFGHQAQVGERQVQKTLDLIHNKASSAEYRRARSEYPGVQHALKQQFKPAYQAMIAGRDALQEVAFASADELASMPAALVQAARQAERNAFHDSAPVAAPRTATELLEKCGVIEREWFEAQADAYAATQA